MLPRRVLLVYSILAHTYISLHYIFIMFIFNTMTAAFGPIFTGVGGDFPIFELLHLNDG